MRLYGRPLSPLPVYIAVLGVLAAASYVQSAAATATPARSFARLSERLIAKHSSGHCHSGPSMLFGRCKFAASGTARGIYPGTFTASGSFSDSEIFEPDFFSESFTITSGTLQITGTIDVMVSGFHVPIPGVYAYTSSAGNGNVEIDSVGPHAPFSETLRGL
jgi:hypothetical protein